MVTDCDTEKTLKKNNRNFVVSKNGAPNFEVPYIRLYLIEGSLKRDHLMLYSIPKHRLIGPDKMVDTLYTKTKKRVSPKHWLIGTKRASPAIRIVRKSVLLLMYALASE